MLQFPWLPTTAELDAAPRPRQLSTEEAWRAWVAQSAAEHDPWEYIRRDRAKVIVYKNGARVQFSTTSDPPEGGREIGAIITDQSDKSRRRCAFAFGNAECSWCAMTTLTWRFPPTAEQLRLAVDRLRRKWKERWGECCDAWLMEMQRRGVPHFHLFHAAESIVGATIRDAPTETFPAYVDQTGRWHEQRTVVRGAFDTWLIGTWLKCTEQLGDVEALRFNRGGICEVLRSPDAAGRYVAKEVGKREQKVLPSRYKDGLGRWWWLKPAWKPIPRFIGELDLDAWPWDAPMAHVWDARLLADCMLNRKAVPNIANVDAWLQLQGFAPLSPEDETPAIVRPGHQDRPGQTARAAFQGTLWD